MLALALPASALASECSLYMSADEKTVLTLSINEGFFELNNEKFETLGCGSGIQGICGISDKRDVFIQIVDDQVYSIDGQNYYRACDSQ
jgi:hypothetical protein